MRGCVEWTGYRLRGYGWRHDPYNKRPDFAHRVAWFEVHGEIPKGMCVLHRCDNPGCINVEHLFLGTRGDNNRDRHQKGRSKGGSQPGMSHPRRKLTLADVATIRGRKGPDAMVASEFNISASNVNLIRNKKTWRVSP